MTATVHPGYEEPQGLRRPKGVAHGANRGRTSWLENASARRPDSAPQSSRTY